MKAVLQKYISQSGYCSRRKAQVLIEEGRVKVNGQKAELGMKVNEGDTVMIDNKPIGSSENKIYIALNKPVGYTSTARKFKNEKSLFGLIDIKERLFIAGRLDKNSRGLVILTNDGEAAYKLTHPKYEHEKEYITQINAKLTQINAKLTQINANKILIKLIKGVDIGEGDGIVKAKDIKYLGDNKFRMILTEGKKRQIRRMFKALGYEVEDLMRVRVGDVRLGKLKEGEWKRIEL